LLSTDAQALAAHNKYVQAQPLTTQDAAAAAAAAVATDAHVVFFHLTQHSFPSVDDLLIFANSIFSFLPSSPEPLLAYVLLSSQSFAPPHSSAAAADAHGHPSHCSPWKPLQSYMFHNAAQVPNSAVRAAVAMCHSVSVRRDLCQQFSIAAIRDSGALCTTRACHLPRELSFDFGFLSKYGA
jgi:hypothetical protein